MVDLGQLLEPNVDFSRLEESMVVLYTNVPPCTKRCAYWRTGILLYNMNRSILLLRYLPLCIMYQRWVKPFTITIQSQQGR